MPYRRAGVLRTVARSPTLRNEIEVTSKQERLLVPRSEVLANLTEAMRALCNLLARGEISELLAHSARPGRPVAGGRAGDVLTMTRNVLLGHMPNKFR
jgi:hypothetical protein